MKKYYLFLILVFFFFACGGNRSSTNYEDSEQSLSPSAEDQKYGAVEDLLLDIDVLIRSYKTNKSEKNFLSLLAMRDKLHYEYDDRNMDSEKRRQCILLQSRVDSVRIFLDAFLNNELSNMKFFCLQEQDHLIKTTQKWPIYLQKGDKLFYNMSTSGNVIMKIYNIDTHSTLKTYIGKKQVNDSLRIQNSAMYLIEISPKGSAYIELNVEKKLAKLEQIGQDKIIRIDTVECAANDFMSFKVSGIDMKNVFEEPKKLTLRSVGGSIFSGSSCAVVAITVPSGCTDILYSLRISTNEGDRKSDGQFNKRMKDEYNKVKFLGLPIYESTKNTSNTSLLREMLYRNVPVREEEAYCNVYVFTNSAEAKKFQDSQSAQNLKYNIDLSLMGTQSCNGRIPVKGLSKIYLGFENERFRYSNYLWLEAIAVTPKTEFYRPKYSVQ